MYGLNLARALGDKFLKVEDLGLSAEPFISAVSVVGNERGAIVIVASDGLWDVMDFREVAGIAASMDRQDLKVDVDINDSTLINDVYHSRNGGRRIAMTIVDAAIKAGTRDDVTVLVVRIRRNV